MADTDTPPAIPTPSTPKTALQSVGDGIKYVFTSALAWEQANPRKVMAIVLYISAHSTHLKPVMDFISMVLGMPVG